MVAGGCLVAALTFVAHITNIRYIFVSAMRPVEEPQVMLAVVLVICWNGCHGVR